MALFLSIGLAENTAKDVAVNRKTRDALVTVVKEAGAEGGCDKGRGVLLYNVSTKFPGQALAHRPMVLGHIMDGGISSLAQLEGAMSFLKKTAGKPLDEAGFRDAAGIGVVVTDEDIRAAVAEALGAMREKLLEERYLVNTNPVLGQVGAKLRFAEGAKVKAELEAQVLALLGPKTAEDEARIQEARSKPKPKAKGKKGGDDANGDAPGAGPGPAAAAAKADAEPEAEVDVFAFLPKPEDNTAVHTTVNFSDGSVMRVVNTPEQLEGHLRRTGGRYMTRFPPEPNGYLHIGHAKAMFIDFGMSEQYDGHCYLRFDDTNPEAEKQEFIDHIQDIVSWMGWKPWKITHASDYFQELYELAVKLIKIGKAYVCHLSSDDIAAYRERREASPWRDTPVEENLRKFEDMRRGMYNEGEVCLRMKMDVKNENYNMFDLIAYRIKYMPHPMAGDKWCIYPSYDFTHCLNDSLEDITHSLCTLEFESRRASYYWLLEVLDMYKPVVYEYSKMQITDVVLSKRRLQKLVYGGYVSGWTDPRLATLAGMRRRGYTPQGINNFCRDMGFSRNENMAYLHKLEHYVRADLEQHAPRRFGVQDPLKLVLTNLPADFTRTVEARHFPGRADDESTYTMPITRELWIECTDFRQVDEKGYYGLAPGKMAMLRYGFAIKCTGCTVRDGAVVEVQAEALIDYDGKPPKGIIHWVSAAHAQPAEFRLFDVLFKSEDPMSFGDNWIEDVNPNSLVIKQGFVPPILSSAKVLEKFQLERVGYFCVDEDTEKMGRLVLNRTVALKDTRK